MSKVSDNYSMFVALDPNSPEAGKVAQVIADTELLCVWCDKPSVGAAVHAEHDGSRLSPLCERHRGWEYAKLQMDSGETIYL